MACLSCKDRLSREFQWESLDTDGINALGCSDWKVAFGHDKSRCLKSYNVNMAWRVFFFLAVLSIQIYSWSDWVANAGPFRYYYIYLTHWTLLVQLIFTMFNLAVGYYSKDDTLDAAKFPWFVKVTWILSEIALPNTFMVFLLYWGLVWTGPEVHAVSVLTHGVNFALQAVDTMLSSQPKFFLHGIYPFLYSLLYLFWSLIHFWAHLDNENGQPYIYSSLNWYGDKTGTLAALIVFFVMPILNLLFWMLVNCLNQIGKKKVERVTPADPPAADEDPETAAAAAAGPAAEKAPVEELQEAPEPTPAEPANPPV